MWGEKTLNGILPHLYEVFIVLQDLHLLIILYSDANFLTFAGHKAELFCKYFDLAYLDLLILFSVLLSFLTFVKFENWTENLSNWGKISGQWCVLCLALTGLPSLVNCKPWKLHFLAESKTRRNKAGSKWTHSAKITHDEFDSLIYCPGWNLGNFDRRKGKRLSICDIIIPWDVEL